ncbi:MAG TPA: hypothetical protein DHW14_05745 [Clostridiales bacterium]|nr:hypothetical protein [Clostridiales bacterium]
MKPDDTLRKCIDQCEKASRQLKSLAEKAADPVVRTALLDGSRHAELSARECRFGLDMARLEKTTC